MKKIELSLIIGLLISILSINFTGFARDVEELKNNVLRVHILANSDSDEDQTLKLKVRDKIVKETSNMFANVDSKDDAIDMSFEKIDLIKKYAIDEIHENGYNYDVNVEIVNTYFTVRDYGNIVMPAGYYDTIRVSIGEASGKNWWCVLYPPMCLPTSVKSDSLFSERQTDILENSQEYKFRFAFLDIVDSIKDFLFGD